MGQGFSLTTPSAGTAGIDVPELADLVYEKSIGTSRFLKSIRARHRDGVVLVKVLVKPYQMSLAKYKEQIIAERKVLADIPNALAYSRVIETDSNAYLVRQFLYNSLYDRISTRPFLEDIEKKWLAYQLLCAVRDCHSRDIYHGDIKTENTLVTSWNWLYLSDFSWYKPVTLPEDNPADFSYFFDTSGRRTCYLAPERFVPASDSLDPEAKVTWAMDIFSTGCVISELFLETPIFSLSQLFKYREGQYDPVQTHLSRIPDKNVREMIRHMIDLDPTRRYSAEQSLDVWKGKVFPDYFYSFLHQYMEVITHPASARYSSATTNKHVGEADDRIDRVYFDFDKLSYFLGYQDDERSRTSGPDAVGRLGMPLFPVRINIPNNEHYVSAHKQSQREDGTLIFLTLVVASLRHTARAASKLRACDVLLAFAERLTDDAKLDRVLPYLVSLLSDPAGIVVMTAIRNITQIVSMVEVVNTANKDLFVEYIFPRLEDAIYASKRGLRSSAVRAVFASCLGTLTASAERFLNLTVSIGPSGALARGSNDVEGFKDTDFEFEQYDVAKQQLDSQVVSFLTALVADEDVFVRRAFLSSVPELCDYLGEGGANDLILTHLNTYLNDRDWTLKCALFDALVGLAAYLGSATTEEYILPLMMQSLMDPEEHVVQAILHSLAEIAKLGLLSRASMVEQVEQVARFTMHPNLWAREAAADFIASAAAPLSPAELRVLLLPQIRPYLKIGMLPEVSESILLDSLKRPLPRSVFDQALVWASKSDRGMFWRPLQKLSSNFVTSISGALGRSDQAPTGSGGINRLARNDEDEQWLSKLRNLGLSPEDEAKLLGLREFIWRLSQMQARDARDTPDTEIDGKVSKLDFTKIVPLNTHGVKIHTIMFEEPRDAVSEAAEPEAGAPRTIADALLDASMTIDDPMGRRKRAALNSHRSRLNSRQELSPSPAEVNRNRMSDTTSLVLQKGGAASNDTRQTSSPVNAAAAAAGNATNSTDRGASSPLSDRRAIRHQSSAMNLLGRTDSAKSGPETSTTEANVFGRMEGPFTATQASPADAEQDADLPIPRIRVAHSYAGNDPDIIKMLDSMYIDNYPHDIAEFGPLVTPVSRRRSGIPSRQGSEQTAWKPSGKLVATFAEHVGAINRMVVSPDHAFFVTGGDDGSVKVWDTGRLEKNITQRSRQTHRHPAGSKVLALCFVENTHCFVSCASDGSVHVVKTDFAIYNDTVRYSKPRLLRDYQLPQDEFAVWCEHFKQESSSVLVLATNRSRVLGIDLRTMAQLFVLENPVHHGTPTSFCMDRKRNWLCLATSHGVFDLWDLRFKMRIKAWGIPGKHTIYRLSIHPTKGRGKWVCAAGGTGQGEVTVWDVEKALCREVYRVGGNKETPKGYEAWEVDQDRPEGMLSRFATNIAAQTADGQGATTSSNADRGVRAMLLATGQAEDQREVRHAFMLTGGSDRKLRFWDLARIENSTVFSGLLPEEGRPSYSASQVTTSLTLNVERLPRSGGGGTSSGAAEGGKAAKSASKAPRSTVISLQSQQLLKSHLDAITDVALIEVPYTMIVSVDRSGVIFVFA